jgi:hypothetical protein
VIHVLMVLLCFNPFYEAQFSSLPYRSVSIFSNPGGLGIKPGAELLYAYHPDRMMPALFLGTIGAGWIKEDTLNFYEIGSGYKFPGAFSIGYAYQFGDTEDQHVFGIVGNVTSQLAIGYKTTIKERRHMFGGISIFPYKNFVTLSGDIEYEGIDDILNYYFGVMIRPVSGAQAYFHSDQEMNWHAGLELSFGYLKIAGAYAKADEKFMAGAILSAQSYESLVPKSSPGSESDFYY